MPKVAALPTLSWVDPTGVEWPLSWSPGCPWHIPPGLKGLQGASPRTLVTRPRGRGGVSVDRQQPGPRLLTVPLFVWGADGPEFRDRWSRLAVAFTSTRTRGPGLFRAARPDGSARQISAVYQEGWDGDPELGITEDTAVMTLLCPDPWWQDTKQTTITRAFAGSAVSYLSPYLSVSSSQTLGRTNVTNPGHVEAWPDWLIHGPASLITAINHTTGQQWSIDPVGYRGTPLLLGETVRITTDPMSVIGPDGSVWLGAMNLAVDELWPLLDGINDVEYAVQGSGGGTALDLSFYPRYEIA